MAGKFSRRYQLLSIYIPGCSALVRSVVVSMSRRLSSITCIDIRYVAIDKIILYSAMSYYIPKHNIQYCTGSYLRERTSDVMRVYYSLDK